MHEKTTNYFLFDDAKVILNAMTSKFVQRIGQKFQQIHSISPNFTRHTGISKTKSRVRHLKNTEAVLFVLRNTRSARSFVNNSTVNIESTVAMVIQA